MQYVSACILPSISTATSEGVSGSEPEAQSGALKSHREFQMLLLHDIGTSAEEVEVASC